MESCPTIDNPPVPGMALVEDVDKEVLVCLHSNELYIGTLRSLDSFYNLVLENVVNRIIVGGSYGDCPLKSKSILIRSENVAYVGVISQETRAPSDLILVSPEEIRKAKKVEIEESKNPAESLNIGNQLTFLTNIIF
mmetsp:Transcript_26473/g.48608  ORF Transcript_26473/g.48608 Transcript_26473/m.48608 type:complete len:137 (-) Transcript_26473:229-639(-)